MSELDNFSQKLIKAIQNTKSEEIQCERALELMAIVSENLLPEAESRNQYPELWHHFEYCVDCLEEYKLNMSIAADEAEGRIPAPSKIPYPKDFSLFSKWKRAINAFVIQFPGFDVNESEMARDVGFNEDRSVVVQLEQFALTIVFIQSTSDTQPDFRTLTCSLFPNDDEDLADFIGSTAWLQIHNEGPAPYQETISETGGLAFMNVRTGLYDFRLQAQEDEIIVSNIELL